nr:xylulose kinase-1 [Tanacetum cinerariifolium]
MTLTFAETHNMIAYLTKSDASEGFNQIIDFLNGSSIKYALTVNPNIYVSCIKQFWTSVAVKKVNDVTRLQVLVDKKKVIITEATIRDALCLDDAEGVFLKPMEVSNSHHTAMYECQEDVMDLVRNVDSPTKFYMYPRFLQLMIKQVSKGFSRVDTSLFEGMLVAQEFGTDDDKVHAEDVNNVGVVAEGGIIANINADKYVILEDAKDVAADAKDGQDADIDKNVVTTAKIITKVVTDASTTLTAATPQLTTVVAPTLTDAPSRRRKGVTEAQARKNMMIYLRNIAGFKMDYFKGMTYDDICPIFEKKFNSNMAFLMKTKEQMDEEDSRALKRLSESQDDKTAKKEDMEAVWRLVKERFATIKPKNFSNDFLLITLGAMFEKHDLQAQIWKNQRSVHGQAKVKSWKLLESCSVQIITFTTTHLILLVERRYPLTRFTLDQMLNNVRLKVEEESKVSLELLRFIRQQHQEGV